MQNANKEQWFRRQTIAERGHFPNTFRLNPVTEIVTTNETICLNKGKKSYLYKWHEVLSAEIERREIYKLYGAGIGGKMVKDTLKLKTADEAFSFDVSSDFPDFRENDQLLNVLKTHVSVTESRVKKFNYGFSILFVAALVVLWWWLKRVGL